RGQLLPPAGARRGAGRRRARVRGALRAAAVRARGGRRGRLPRRRPARTVRGRARRRGGRPARRAARGRGGVRARADGGPRRQPQRRRRRRRGPLRGAEAAAMSLFEKPGKDGKPLAERMRPRTLAEFVGQGHLLGADRPLRRAIEAGQAGSLILFGPPGVGKTTLAHLIARHSGLHFTALSAVLSGVKDLRDAVAEADARRRASGQGTLLFVDEIHRFNKAQQDALLPFVESGQVVLVGATTENPAF